MTGLPIHLVKHAATVQLIVMVFVKIYHSAGHLVIKKFGDLDLLFFTTCDMS